MSLEIENICQSINNSKLYDDPFNHLYINNFFSENFYNRLLEFLPKKDQYTQINKTKSVSADYPDERYIYNITPETFENFYPEQKVFFGELVIKVYRSQGVFERHMLFFIGLCVALAQRVLVIT